MRYLIARADWLASPAKSPHDVPVDCCWCGSGEVFPEPREHPRLPCLWTCLKCRGQFSVEQMMKD